MCERVARQPSTQRANGIAGQLSTVPSPCKANPRSVVSSGRDPRGVYSVLFNQMGHDVGVLNKSESLTGTIPPSTPCLPIAGGRAAHTLAYIRAILRRRRVRLPDELLSESGAHPTVGALQRCAGLPEPRSPDCRPERTQNGLNPSLEGH